MKLKCPSCATEHETADHPGAFDIQCKCGYSILLPNEALFEVPVMGRAAKDNKTSASEPEPVAERAEPTGMANITPPDQLPQGMVYDPFELNTPSADGMAMEAQPAEAAPPSTAAAESIGVEPFMMPPPSEILPGEEQLQVPAPPIEEMPSAAPQALSGQAIVDRTLALSVGQFLGPPYDLQWEGMSREALVALAKRCEIFLTARPWLRNELESRGVYVEKIPDFMGLTGVPELLAVEIYMTCFELGGRCHFHRSDVATEV